MNYLVIKCGGSVLENLPHSFYADVVQLKEEGQWQPVIVHGGGPLINSLLEKLEIEPKFVDGLRVTTEEVLDVVEMVLSGSVNKQIVRKIAQAGGKALGISGVDGGLLLSKPTAKADILGLVGEVIKVNHAQIELISQAGYIPVISPLGIDQHGQRLNINGDVAASAVAQSLKAKLCFISDIPGIYVEKDNQKVVLKEISKSEVEQLIRDQVIYGGMIPKVKAALDGLAHDVPEVAIINGMDEHSLLDFCQGKQVGTKLVVDKEGSHV